LEVGGLKVQVAVSTVVPTGCCTVTTALVKAISVMASVHIGFGHPGAPRIGDTGGAVVTLKGVFPFLIALAGMASLPETVTGAGF
jgi:hypothetical protein